MLADATEVCSIVEKYENTPSEVKEDKKRRSIAFEDRITIFINNPKLQHIQLHIIYTLAEMYNERRRKGKMAVLQRYLWQILLHASLSDLEVHEV